MSDKTPEDQFRDELKKARKEKRKFRQEDRTNFDEKDFEMLRRLSQDLRQRMDTGFSDGSPLDWIIRRPPFITPTDERLGAPSEGTPQGGLESKPLPISRSFEQDISYGPITTRNPTPRSGDIFIEEQVGSSSLATVTSPGAVYVCYEDGSWNTVSVKNNLAASAAPSATTDDIDTGYDVGSIWLDTTNDIAYICIDNTQGVAVWLEIGSTAASGGTFHVDYIVDPSYGGSEGDTITLSTGSSVDVYTTVDGAITAADAANGVRTIYVVAGTYVENITIDATMAHDVHIIGEAPDRTVIGGIASGNNALTLDGSANVYIYNLTLRGTATGGGHSLTTGASNAGIIAHNCIFDAPVSGNFTSSYFDRCVFEAGYDVEAGDAPSSVFFTDCDINTTCTWAAAVDQHYFENCIMGAAADVITNSSNIDNVVFTNCLLGSSGAGKAFFTKTGGYIRQSAFIGCRFAPPASAAGVFDMQTVTASTGSGLLFDACTFQTNSTHPFIKGGSANFDVTVINCDLVDNSNAYITGTFGKSVFGPNFPPDFQINIATGSTAGSVYIGTGTVTADDDDVLRLPFQSGTTDPPTHVAPVGTPYFETATPSMWISTGGGSWTEFAPSAGGGGNVSNTGTPVDSQIAVWTSATVIEGTADFTFDGADFLMYNAVNDGNPEYRLGASDAEELHIQTVFDAAAQTLDYVLFQTDAASATADKGEYRFNVDGTEILQINDSGLNLVTGLAYYINDISVLSGTALGSGVASSSLTSVGTLTGLTMGGNIVMADNSVTGIDTLTFTDTAGTIAGIQNQNLVDKTATESITGSWNFGAASVLEIPNSDTLTAPSVNGEIGVDTLVTDWSHGVLYYFGGELLGVVAMPSTQFVSPTGGYVVSYNATNDEFELVAQSGGASSLDEAYNGGVLITVDAGAITLNAASGATSVMNFELASDTQPQFDIFLDGTLRWGPGGASTYDISVYRSAVTDLRFSSASADLFSINAAHIRLWDIDEVIWTLVNDGNPQIRMGASDAEELHIQTVYDTGAQTLDYVLFQTEAASATADKGLFRFNVDGTNILDIDDGGLELTGSITVSGTVDGRDIATDGTKLDGIESGATADQTTEEIQDIAGPLVATGGTKTGITVTYQDATGDMDFVTDVQKTGTPLNNQIAVWVDASTLEGTSDFTFDGQDLIFYNAVNDGNPDIRIGAADAEEFHIWVNYDIGTQVLNYVLFQTDTASATADKGEFRFSVDETLVTTIDDGGIEIKASGSLSFGTVDILTDSAGTTTLSNIDAIDTTTGAAIEADVNHDLLVGFVGNEHIDWTSTSSNFNTSGSITGTGAVDFSGASSMKIYTNATPAVSVQGQIAIDTTVTDFAEDMLVFFGGTNIMYAVTLPADNMPSGATEDGYSVTYDATLDEFKLTNVSGGSGAPTTAQYVTLATDGTLTQERVLTQGTGITVTDAGAGSTVTISTTALLRERLWFIDGYMG